MLKLRELREEDVEFTIEIQEEDILVRGHFASGDDQADREMEDEIMSRLERNDLWAWCHVIVRATYKDWTGEDSLGACSYENEADFKVEGGYYSDMKRAALAILNEKLQDAAKDLLPLVEPDGLDTTSVKCKLCHKYTLASSAHLHDGEYVGECCWDERLRTTT